MATVKLGARPATFKRTVSFPMLDGTEGSIEVVYKYRTRTEYATFADEWRDDYKKKVAADNEQKIKAYESAVAAAKESGGEPPSIDSVFPDGDIQRAAVDGQAQFIMDIAEGWNIPDKDFTLENVIQLCDELPDAAEAIQRNYREALTGARLGN